MELYIIGRKDRKVKTTDVLVHLDSIERAIISTALVKNAAAFSRPHPILGEQIEAAIVPLKEGTDPSNEVVTILRTKLSRFEIPKRWHLLHALPELPNMKVDYNLLKTMY
jgi:acyl-coenzyme A synthetase/AMP-(fatty) acid ligase